MRFPVEPNVIMATLDPSGPTFILLTTLRKKDFIDRQLSHSCGWLLHILPEPSTMKTKSTLPAHKQTRSFNQTDVRQVFVILPMYITQLSLMIKCILRSKACSKSVCFNIYYSSHLFDKPIERHRLGRSHIGIRTIECFHIYIWVSPIQW